MLIMNYVSIMYEGSFHKLQLIYKGSMADQVTIHQYLTGWIRYTDLKCDTNINKTNTGQIAKNNSCKLTGTNIKARN